MDKLLTRGDRKIAGAVFYYRDKLLARGDRKIAAVLY